MRMIPAIVASVGALTTTPTAHADTFFDTYQRGLAAFKLRDYAGARAEFLRAYDLRAEPIILFNIAQTYRLELRGEQALAYYKRFLAESQIAEDLRGEAERHVAALEAQQQATDAQRRHEAEAGPTEHDGTPIRITAPPMDRGETRAIPSTSSERHVPIASWISFGVGGLGLVGAVGFGVLGLRREHELHALVNPSAHDTVVVERLQLATNLSLAVTGAAALTGVVWYFVAPAHTARTSLALAPRDRGWSVTWSATF